jgi:uncharacterized protein YndB with AHSA1/START domain
MITRATVDVNAPTERVWEVFTDVAKWPSWTASVTSIEPLDGPGIEAGHRFRIKQPRLPTVVWQVTQVDAPRSWTWVVRSAGALTAATHDVAPQGASACVVTQVIDQRGILGAVFAVMTRRLTRRYLALEGNGLKAASEKAHPLAPQP